VRANSSITDKFAKHESEFSLAITTWLMTEIDD